MTRMLLTTLWKFTNYKTMLTSKVSVTNGLNTARPASVTADSAYEDLKKIDTMAVDGLSGTSNSLAYRIEEIEKHFHNSEQIYGNLDNAMAIDVPVKFTVTGGNNAWGTELMLTDGTVIESGSATKKFDLNEMYIVSVSAANKISIIEFLYSPINTGVACTFDFTGGAADDIVLAVAHGLADGDKVVLKAGAGALPAELNDYTTYYVVNKADDYFQVSLTTGGSAVEFTDDGGAAFFYPINAAGVAQGAVTQSNVTKTVVSFAATNDDSYPYPLRMPRIPCNSRLFIRAKSETGSTIGIGFLLGLHPYEG